MISEHQNQPEQGRRIKHSSDCIKKEIIQQYLSFSVPDISDQLHGLFTMKPDIQNISNDHKLIGTARTVKLPPGDNLMIHKMLDLAMPGDVIVVDTGNNHSTAVVGGLIAQKAKCRKIAGFVIDGQIRDVESIIEIGLPVFARGIHPAKPKKSGPGEINFAICCGGVVVNSGDLIVADINGVVVIQHNFVHSTLSQLKQTQKRSQQYIQDVKHCTFSNQWVDVTLDNLNYTFFRDNEKT